MRHSLIAMLISALPLTGCMWPPATLDLSLDKPTTRDKYVVAIHPQAADIVINRLHDGRFSYIGALPKRPMIRSRNQDTGKCI